MKSLFYYNRFIKIWLFIFSISLYLGSFYFVNIIPTDIGYKYTFLLPLCFIICFYFFLWDLIVEYKSPYLISFSVVAFFRYVILPYALLNEGTYSGVAYLSPSDENLQLASWLIMYELLVVTIVIRVFYKKIVKQTNPSNLLVVQKNNFIYIFFFLGITALVLLIPQAREGISIFLNINVGGNDDLNSNVILLIRECFIISKYLIYFAILSYVYRSKELSQSTIVFILILIFALMVINVQIGTNRKNIISDAFALFFLLIIVFPKRKYSTITILSISSIVMFFAFTIYRGFVDQGEGLFSYLLSVGVLQSYLLGEYNVALAIEAKHYFGHLISLKNLLMDIFRPAFGIGSLLKDVAELRSGEIFSERLSLGGLYRDDQIVPMIGQGFMYFGIIFSPIFSVIAAFAGMYCDSLYKKSSSMEATFFSAYFAINLAQAMSLSTTILVNILTFKIAIILPLFYANLLINNSLNKKYRRKT